MAKKALSDEEVARRMAVLKPMFELGNRSYYQIPRWRRFVNSYIVPALLAIVRQLPPDRNVWRNLD